MRDNQQSIPKFFKMKEGCSINPWEFFINNGHLPIEQLEEITEAESRDNLSETIAYGLTSEQVKSHFRGDEQIFGSIPA